jgi:predicted transposase/invertase (TIGR01784 family)
LDTAWEEGKVEGKIEGKIEEKIEIAIEMLKNDEAIEKISKYTGLTDEQINEILRKHKDKL